ncbi:helix-turn-helix transcriptional regulator [Faecalibaculum rodentium]|uniref:helix-turn-helix transcriptional regulator n=1 Tax=Faecalibaculum rodentium TaxID=1702221 RepID=UPI0023F3AAE9|nr:helix-turn-helix transcriptional regulator [Faecalibaculum rodentium]
MKNCIKDVRNEQGVSQEELAEKSGVSRRILSLLETGAAESTTTKTMQAIAKALGKESSEIFFLE